MIRPNQVAWLIAVATGALTSGASAQTSQPDRPPPGVERILDRVQARGEGLDSLKAKMKYELNQTLVDEKMTRTGTILYLRKWEPDPKGADPERAKDPHAGQRERVLFRVEFDTRTTNDYTSTKKEVFSFDGRWIHEKNETTKMLIHRQIVADDRLLNPTRLGQGPFPAPFGQKKQDVLANFAVKLVPPAEKDPKETDHLELVPRRGTDLARTYKKVDLFVSRKLNLPVRMVTLNKSEEIVTAEFTDIEVNPKKVGEKDFELKKTLGYTEVTERLQPAGPPK